MVDADVLGWDANGVIDSFQRRQEWDVVCANGVMFNGVYRDTYAFRAPDIETNHHWSGNDLGQYNISVEQLSTSKLTAAKKRLRKMQTEARRRMEHPDRESNIPPLFSLGFSTIPAKLVSVESCFAGFAIYKTSIIESCMYTHRHREPPHMLDCEHVMFHECVRGKNAGRIFANPNMKLWYGHSIFDKSISKIYTQAVQTIAYSVFGIVSTG